MVYKKLLFALTTIVISAVLSLETSAQTEHVYYLDANHQMTALDYNNGWTAQTVMVGSGPYVTFPQAMASLAADIQGFPPSGRIFVSNDLYQLAFQVPNYSQWFLDSVDTSVLGGRDGGITAFADSIGIHVFFYAGNDCSIAQSYQDNSTNPIYFLSFIDVGQTVCAAPGRPLAAFSDSGHNYFVFDIDGNSHVRVLSWNHNNPYLSQGWTDTDLASLTGALPAAVPTGLAAFVNSNGRHVYYVNSSAHVCELYWNSNNGWSKGDLTANHGNVPVASPYSLTAFYDSVGEHVFYVGANQHLYQLYWSPNGGWSNADLTANRGGPLVAIGSKLTSFADPLGEHVFYMDTNQHVNQFYWNSANGWSNTDLTARTGAPQALAGSVMTSFAR